MGGPNPHRGKARQHRPLRTLAPTDRIPSHLRQALCQNPGRNRLMAFVSAHARRWPTLPRVGFGGKRFLTRGPDACVLSDPYSVGEAAPGQFVAELRRAAVARIRDHRSWRQILLEQPIDLLQGDPPLLLVSDFLGNPGLPPPLGIVCPDLGEI